MTITFFEDEYLAQNDNDFYGDWIKLDTTKKLKGKTGYAVREIIRAKSGKGYLLCTDSFNVWLWKKSKIANQIIEALEIYTTKGGYSIVVVPVNNKQDGYKIGVDKQETVLWYTNGKKYSIQPIPEEEIEVEGVNPFL